MIKYIAKKSKACNDKLCNNQVVKNPGAKFGKVRFGKCKKEAARFTYFDGRDTIRLCGACADEFRDLNLTVKELKYDTQPSLAIP